MTKVSVIITTRNRCSLLENAIHSVCSQTEKNLECIVVDDASLDETRSRYQNDSRIIYVRIEPENSRGGNYARNQGILRASGEILAFLDDDDIWLPSKLEKQLALLKKFPNSVIFCGRAFVRSAGAKEKRSFTIPPAKFSGNISRLIRTTYVTSTSCLLIPKKLFDLVGLFDEKLTFWQEYELTIRLAQVSNFYFVPEALVVCRDDVTITERVSNKVLNWKENVLYIREKHRNLYETLTWKENWLYHATLMKDAFRRHRRAGKKIKMFCYGVCRLILELPLRLFRK